MNQHQFFTGEIFDAYHWFGAHIEQNAVVFRTFAPNASRITLTGAMNGWTETDLHQDGRSGFWSVSLCRTPAQASLQVPHLRRRRLRDRALRPLRLRHGTAPGVLLDHHRPREPLHRRKRG